MRNHEKPGARLDYSDPASEAVRVFIQKTCKECGTHERLILNFDQVWSLRFRPRKHVLQQSSGQQPVDQFGRSTVLRRAWHFIERALDLPLTESLPGIEAESTDATIRRPEVQGKECAGALVDQWRCPRTVTTLSYIDGSIGRLFVTMKKGDISEKVRNQINGDLSRWLMVSSLNEQSHMWNERTFIEDLDHLSEERNHVCTYTHCSGPLILPLYHDAHICICIYYVLT